jgi:uncharacterized membrane protein
MSTETGPTRPDREPGVGRLLSLSDGVVAIALTLLVLQLQIPHLDQLRNPDSASELAAQLAKGGSQLISYVVSFYVIAQFWIIHRGIFRSAADEDGALQWWNFAFLFTITIMPFTSDLLGAFTQNPLAVDIFALNLLLASLSTQVMVLIGARKGVLNRNSRSREGWVRAVVVPIVMAASIGLSWWSTSVAMYSWVLLAVGPPLVNRLLDRRGS